MTAPRLEIVYRRLLRCYPPRWQQQHADEVVATLLDVADAEGRTRPSPGEAANLLAHGLAARFGASLGLLPETVRNRVAALAFASVATLSCTLFVVAEVLPGPLPVDRGYRRDGSGLSFGPFVTMGAALYPLPVLAFVAAAAKARRVARAMLGLTCLAVLTILVVPLATPSMDAERPQLYLLVVLGLLAVLAAGGYSAGVSRRDLFGAVALHGLLLAGATALSVSLFRRAHPGAHWNWPLHAYRGYGGLLDTVEMIVPAVVAVGALLATAASVRRPGWIVAVFAISGIWSLLPIADSIRYGRWSWENTYAGLGFLFVFGLIALAAVVDLFRAAGLKVVRTSDLPHNTSGSPARAEPNTFTTRSTLPGPPPAP